MNVLHFKTGQSLKNDMYHHDIIKFQSLSFNPLFEKTTLVANLSTNSITNINNVFRPRRGFTVLVEGHQLVVQILKQLQ